MMDQYTHVRALWALGMVASGYSSAREYLQAYDKGPYEQMIMSIGMVNEAIQIYRIRKGGILPGDTFLSLREEIKIAKNPAYLARWYARRASEIYGIN